MSRAVRPPRAAGTLRVAVVTAALTVTAVLISTSAAAAPASAAPVQERCALDDPRLRETSGLVDTPAGPAVVGDSGTSGAVATLGPDCAVTSLRTPPATPRDVEDLARAADGTLWLADIGDNRVDRATIAVVRLPERGPGDTVRLAYPDGPHDAETLLLPADGRPVIVTKGLLGTGAIYTTAAPLPPRGGAGDTVVALERVGQVVVPPSGTNGGPVGSFGRGLYTGGALSADGRVAALRTYTDAWLYPAGPTADDVVAGLGATPVQVPLPDEPQGEAVAFTPDGALLSAGESVPGRTGGTATLRVVPGAAGLVADRAPSSASPSGTASPSPPGADGSGPTGVPTTPAVLGGVTVGVIVLVTAVTAFVAARRRGGPRPTRAKGTSDHSRWP